MFSVVWTLVFLGIASSSGDVVQYAPAFETKEPPTHCASLVCGLVNAPGFRGVYVRGPLLHPDADEARLQHHLPGVDPRDVQLRRRALAVEELEHVVGRGGRTGSRARGTP